MEKEDKFPKKKFCYKDDCQITRSGFFLEDYPVCKKCKLELTESLYNSIKERQKNDKELEEQIDLMWKQYE